MKVRTNDTNVTKLALKRHVPVLFHQSENQKSRSACQETKTIPTAALRTRQNICYYHEGELDRAFCWKSSSSKRCSVQHEGNKWKEGKEPAEEVGSYPGAAWRSHGTGAGARKSKGGGGEKGGREVGMEGWELI